MKKGISFLVLIISLIGWVAFTQNAEKPEPEAEAGEEKPPEDLKDFKSSVEVQVDTPIDFWVDM